MIRYWLVVLMMLSGCVNPRPQGVGAPSGDSQSNPETRAEARALGQQWLRACEESGYKGADFDLCYWRLANEYAAGRFRAQPADQSPQIYVQPVPQSPASPQRIECRREPLTGNVNCMTH